MSDFDEKDIHKDVTSDFDEADIHAEASPATSADISKMESFGRGIQEGGTLGAAPQTQGAVEAALDKAQSILASVGLADPSPSDVNAKLSSEGVKGDIGPQSTLDLYRQARDSSKAQMDAAQRANPGSFLAGNIVGGIPSTMALPGSVTAPFGEAAQGAGMLAKAQRAGLNAMPLGALIGANTSSGDLTKGEIGKVADDAAQGATIAPFVGGGLNLAGNAVAGTLSGTGKVLGKGVPKVLKTAYNEPMDVKSPEFYDDVTNNLNKTVKEVADPIQAKQNEQVKAHEERTAKIESDMQASAKKAQDLEIGRQKSQNAEDLEYINQETVKTANKLQKDIYDTKKKLGTNYNEIDAAAEKTGVAPENRDVIGDFQEIVANQSGLPDSEVASIAKKFENLLGKKDPQSYRNLKTLLNNYGQNNNQVVKRAANAAYSKLKANYAQELTDAGFEGLAKRLDDTNKRWSAASELEDQFLSNLKPNRVTGEIETSPDTINAISNFQKTNPKQIAQSEFLTNLLNKADPEGAPQTIKGLQTLADTIKGAKNFTPQVPELPPVPKPEDNPDYQRLSDLLKQHTNLKGNNPMKVDGVDLVPGPQAMQKELTNVLPKYGQQTGDTNTENQLKGIFDFLAKAKGEDSTNALKQDLGKLSDRVALRDAQGGGSQNLPTDTMGLVKKVLGSTTGIANKAGRAVRSAQESAQGISEAINKPIEVLKTTPKSDGQEFLNQGVKGLADATPVQIDELGTKMATEGGVAGKEFAQVLSQAKGKNNISRNAIMFGLMQKPEFRALYHKLTSGEENEPVK